MKKIVFLIASLIAFYACSTPKATINNLAEAAKTERRSAVCCEKFAEKAHAENFQCTANLLKALAKSQEIQQKRFAELVDKKNESIDYSGIPDCKVDSTTVNLYRLLADFQYEYYNMYPEYVEVAEKEGYRKAKKEFENVINISKNHVELTSQLIDSIVNGNSDNFLGQSWYVCNECGLVGKDEPKPKQKCSNCKNDSFLIYKI